MHKVIKVNKVTCTSGGFRGHIDAVAIEGWDEPLFVEDMARRIENGEEFAIVAADGSQGQVSTRPCRHCAGDVLTAVSPKEPAKHDITRALPVI